MLNDNDIKVWYLRLGLNQRPWPYESLATTAVLRRQLEHTVGIEPTHKGFADLGVPISPCVRIRSKGLRLLDCRVVPFAISTGFF